MAANPFQRASKSQSKLRLALAGTAGAGKTYTALTVGTRLAELSGGRTALIDTEHGSASLYADTFDFDAIDLADFHPQNYVKLIHAAESAGYAVVIIDSLTHEWDGKPNGVLDLVDQATLKEPGRNSYTAWRHVTPLHKELIEAMVGSSIHVIACMRSKQDYAQEKGDNGKTTIRKVGLAPIQREGMDYEFTLMGEFPDAEHNLVITKSRISAFAGAVVRQPDAGFADKLFTWLSSGEPATSAPVPQFHAPASNGHEPAEQHPPAQSGAADEALRRLLSLAAQQLTLSDAEVYGIFAVTGAEQLKTYLREHSMTVKQALSYLSDAVAQTQAADADVEALPFDEDGGSPFPGFEAPHEDPVNGRGRR